MKYLPDYVEYPDIAEELLPHGTMYAYISSTFVNGFLNYSKPVKAFLMHRYEQDPEVNQEAAKKLGGYHTSLSLGDDVLMLSKSDKSNEYWYFWLDNDVSDCCIGRFVTEDSEEEIVKEFTQYVKKTQQNLGYVDHDLEPIELDVSKIKGWIKF